MTATTRGAATLSDVRLSLAGLLRSEWIKLRTLRSTVWCYVLIVILTVGVGVLASINMTVTFGSAGAVEDARQATILSATVGVPFTQLIAAVLGVLTIGGEYRTGMIRSTLTAAPRRTGAYFAKAIVLAVTTFVVAVVAAALTAAVTAPVLSARGVTPVLGRADVLFPVLGSAVYVALIGVLAFAVGTIVRNTAGGLAVVFALLLVVPAVVGIFSGLTDGAAWAQNIGTLLPSAGSALYAYAPAAGTAHGQPGVIVLNAWGGGAVLLAWVFVLGGLGGVLLKKRDA